MQVVHTTRVSTRGVVCRVPATRATREMRRSGPTTRTRLQVHYSIEQLWSSLRYRTSVRGDTVVRTVHMSAAGARSHRHGAELS